MKGKDYIKRDVFLNLINKNIQEVYDFFLNQDYKKLNSYPHDNEDVGFYSLLVEIAISEYPEIDFNTVFCNLTDQKLKKEIANHFSINDIEEKRQTSINNFTPTINIALLFASEDFFKVNPYVVRIPVEKGISSEDTVLNYLNNNQELSNYIINKSELIENNYEQESSFDILYYVYTNDTTDFVSILELENIKKNDILILNNYLKSFEIMFIDEDVLEVIKKKRNALLKLIGKQ